MSVELVALRVCKLLLDSIVVVAQVADLPAEHDECDDGGRGQHHGGDVAAPPAADVEAHGRRHLVDGFGDAVPHTLGSGVVVVGEQCRDLPQLGDFRAATWALGQVCLHRVALLWLDRVEAVGAEQRLDLLVGQLDHDASPLAPTPDFASSSRMRRMPDRIRLFTVPSGCASTTATSR